MELILKNVLEEIVDVHVDRVMKEMDVCNCQKCRMDVMAIALNDLVPKYVVSETGSLLEYINCYSSQNQVTIYQSILDAIKSVSATPRHEKYLREMYESQLNG